MTEEELSLIEDIQNKAWQYGRWHEAFGEIERIASGILRNHGVPENDSNPRKKILPRF